MSFFVNPGPLARRDSDNSLTLVCSSGNSCTSKKGEVKKEKER